MYCYYISIYEGDKVFIWSLEDRPASRVTLLSENIIYLNYNINWTFYYKVWKKYELEQYLKVKLL